MNGLPQLDVMVDDCAAEPSDFFVYDSVEDAQQYVNILKWVSR